MENENAAHGICTSLVTDALILGTAVTRKHHLVTKAIFWKENRLLLLNSIFHNLSRARQAADFSLDMSLQALEDAEPGSC